MVPHQMIERADRNLNQHVGHGLPGLIHCDLEGVPFVRRACELVAFCHITLSIGKRVMGQDWVARP